ncbi:MAG: hypothetical protein JWN03_4841 [Nocardia sp.]|uniref:hypothetical protein n=1 Tax=Nocardia sp. TaxID=1821 RepID=UPI00260E105D|nr:hypothetical protein [Nocardia sp.]MCU1644566.1 hypothetical protein [Nocardia sp.]
MAAPRKTSTVAKTPGGDEGRFYEIQRELASKRRGPYHLTADVAIQPLTRRQARLLAEIDDEEEQLRILLGDAYDAVDDLFADRPIDEWVAFQNDLYAHFYGEGAMELPGGSEGS